MNKQMKLFLIILASLFIMGALLAYGASTSPEKSAPTKQPKTTKKQLQEKLTSETQTITAVLLAAYPNITTDYTIGDSKLYGEGQWFGTTLTYKGADTDNRDTLRVLMQKKDGIWILRTTPPEPLLSAKKYPDVPRDILISINKPVSLPAGNNSPAITSGE